MPKPSSPLPVTRRSLALVTAALVFVACGPGASSSPSSPAGSPDGSDSPTASDQPSIGPTTGGLEHKTGATDVLLRVETGGGFVPIDFLASQAPTFTLYGNGVVVFQQQLTTFPEPDANGVIRSAPWRTASLDESQVQELLEFALGLGGLGAARADYNDGMIADAPSTIFDIHAGGIDKKVTVNALSEETQPGSKDVAARKAFWSLAKRLTDFDQGGKIASDVYAPDRFRAVLIEREAQPGVASIDWPWPAIPFTDFKAGPADGSGPTTFPHKTLTAADVAALNLGDLQGGVQGVTLKAPNAKLYSLVIRPLLAEETE